MRKKVVLFFMLAIASVMGVQAQRFAFIDMEYIAQQIPAFQRVNTEVEALSKQYQAAVEAQNAQAKKLFDEYQATANKLTAAQRTEKEKAIVAKEKEAKELRTKYFGPEGELQKRRQALMSPLQDKVYEAVKYIATQKGYDAIFDRASAQGVFFASPRIDISNEVLQRVGNLK